jgi:hypothetical protein
MKCTTLSSSLLLEKKFQQTQDLELSRRLPKGLNRLTGRVIGGQMGG